MTQTPLQEEEAAGTLAAAADLEELDPTAGVVRRAGEDRSWHEPADVEAARARTRRPALGFSLAEAPMLAAGVLAGGALLTGAGLLFAARTARRLGPFPMARRLRRRR